MLSIIKILYLCIEGSIWKAHNKIKYLKGKKKKLLISSLKSIVDKAKLNNSIDESDKWVPYMLDQVDDDNKFFASSVPPSLKIAIEILFSNLDLKSFIQGGLFILLLLFIYGLEEAFL